MSRSHNDGAQRTVSRRAGLPLLLVAAGLAVYLNGLAGPFLFDDFEAIVDNAYLRAPDPLTRAFRAPDQSTLAGRPLVTATFALNFAIGGLDVRGYHLGNVAIHLACGLLLFGIVRRTLAGPALALRFGEAAPFVALVTALVWVVHPLCTEAVDYLVQRTETLMACCYLLTLYATIRARGPDRRRLWVALAVAACAAGMASKESMVTCPVVVVLYELAYHDSTPGRGARWPLWAALASCWTLLALLIAGGPRRESVGFGLGIDAFGYLENQLVVVLDYLWHVVWPHPLVFDYGYPSALGPRDVALEAGIFAVLGLTVLVAAFRRPAAGFPALAFFVLLAPTSSVVPVVTEVGAERRMYLPLAALAALAVPAGHAALGWLFGRHPLRARRARAALAVVLVVALGAATIRRNADYRDAETIWRSAVRATPRNARAYNGLGRVLYRERRLDEAEAAYRRALEIESDFYHAQFNLGLLLAERGRQEEALERFRSAARLQPSRGEPHYRIATVLSARGRREEAIVELRRAVRLDPSLWRAHNDLGNALASAGRHDDAIHHLHRAVELRPDDALAHYNLSLALGAAGDVAGAIAENRAALEIEPDLALAHSNLGALYQAQGRLEQAVESYRRALEIDPGTDEAWNNLGLALAALGRFGEAERCFRQALRIDPDFDLARRNLAALAADPTPRAENDQ